MAEPSDEKKPNAEDKPENVSLKAWRCLSVCVCTNVLGDKHTRMYARLNARLYVCSMYYVCVP
jgi:hypothetical protein